MPKKILLVEDYPANILVMTTLLEHLGHDCDVAKTGEEAIEKVQGGGSYNLMFMDLHLPVMDGFRACEHIRRFENQESRPSTPIIGLTADVSDAARQRSQVVGMNGIMEKTLNVDELASMIASYAA